MAGTTTHERARLGAAIRHGHDPADIASARRDLAEAKIEKAIQDAVASAPPLTAEQRERLALLLHPGTGAAS